MTNAVEDQKEIFDSFIENNEEIGLNKNNKSIIQCMLKIYHSLSNESDIDAYLNGYVNIE